jgi:hypothetical protein
MEVAALRYAEPPAPPPDKLVVIALPVPRFIEPPAIIARLPLELAPLVEMVKFEEVVVILEPEPRAATIISEPLAVMLPLRATLPAVDIKETSDPPVTLRLVPKVKVLFAVSTS